MSKWMSGLLLTLMPAWVAGQESTGQSSSLVSGNIMQVSLGLLGVLVVFFMVVYLLKRFPNMHSGLGQGHIRIIDGLHLGTRERIILVQLDKQQILLGISPTCINTLHVLPDPIEFPAAQTKSDFAGRLASFLNPDRHKKSQLS